ncbi:hypothetical protein HMPREF1246_0184 [Acidaminococcus sp. BV3L6]|nr:hypothetical protein HMPREF1246_0184 [Acidaminococcus sp. BV3L6]
MEQILTRDNLNAAYHGVKEIARHGYITMTGYYKHVYEN